VAWESNGQGAFTLRAAGVLQAGVDGLSNQGFLDRVTQAFGANPSQHPNIDCARANAAAAFLGSRGGALAGAAVPTAHRAAPSLDVKPLLEAIETLLRQLPPP
jgi:hypothetical protein